MNLSGLCRGIPPAVQRNFLAALTFPGSSPSGTSSQLAELVCGKWRVIFLCRQVLQCKGDHCLLCPRAPTIWFSNDDDVLNMGSRCIVPPEVISHILFFLSPQQVVRLRVVSKQFHDITYGRAIWTTLYMNAPLPRPPGPFPSQTVQFLEHTLVQSERLAHSWTTQPMEDISSVGIRSHTSLLHFSSVVHGRWLIGCERYGKVKVVGYDLEPDAGSHPHQLLWEDYMCYICDACPVVSSSGLLVHVLFSADSVSWKLLEFRVDGNSLRHTLTLDIPPTQLKLIGLYVRIHGGHSPFSYIKSVCQRLIFDTETQSFYEFPPFRSELVSREPYQLP
ncbi:hypothetical protein JVT61DRAFT_6171 [Boletus reticuloceps]|uniref:F-box domain-containing protein n=1 Tax=Boletus reticuloceps TaxID=495285 RepID=A0A8I2YKG2_9AGAM|nr:hypothetical protein JVT61DRAFT_6171 [Boletus reticuloceps]